MTYREVQGSLNKDFFETLIEDILAHSESPTYEVLYISVQPDSKYDYKTTFFVREQVPIFRVLPEPPTVQNRPDSKRNQKATIYAMKLCIGTYAAIGVLFSQTVAAAATPQSLRSKAEAFAKTPAKRQNVDWQFSLFQNEQCTGEADPYSGFGSTGCRSGLLNGSAAGFIKTLIDPDCSILLFADENCTPDLVVAEIGENTGNNCQSIINDDNDNLVQSWGAFCP